MRKWVETNGKEPIGFENTDFGWVRWNTGEICLTETYGYIAWEQTTHYMADPDIKEPSQP